MGFKENFAQAVRELTGGKDDNATPAEKKGVKVENLRRAVDDDQFEANLRHELNTGEISGNYTKQSAADADEGVAASVEEDITTPLPDLNFNVNEIRDKKPSADKTEFYSQTNPNAFPFSSAAVENQNVPMFEPAPPPVTSPYPGAVTARGDDTYGSNAGAGITNNFVTGKNGYSGGYNGGYGNNNGSSNLREFTPAGASEDELTVISRNTIVDGNIRSFANMSIDGDIKGDVETTKNIDLNGKIVGDVICNNAEMHISQIQGNIRMKGNIDMERDTLLIGDIISTYARVNGKVKGNLDVAGKAELKSDAVIFGDISASTITVDDGAIIQGYVSTTFLNKEESRNIFPDAITIGTD